MEGFARKLQNLQDQLEGKIRPSAENILTSSPFTAEIVDYKAPSDIKILEHATYDGTGDPREHLVSYQAKMQKEIQTIEGLDEQVAITFFIESLRAGKLFIDLHNDKPKTYVEAIQRASRQADTKEAVKPKRHNEAAESSSKKPRPDPRGRTEHERSSRPEGRWAPERAGAPPYRPTVAQSVQEEKRSLPPPPPLKPGDQPEILPLEEAPSKYCRYQRSATHTTEECSYLKNEIETLIQKGAPPPPNQWRRCPRQDRSESRNDRGKQPVFEEEEANWKHNKPVINMIGGGPEGGDSSSSCKAWALKKVCRELIVFTDEDLPRGQFPYRDALVTAMDVNGTIIRRVLVDTTNSVNVLYLEVFNKLELERDKLILVKTPLAGFTRDSVESEGSIRLSIEIGIYPNLRNVEMEFVVVDLSCSHNMILGRPNLEDLGELISIDHLCLKFRTLNGIGVARCDQKVAPCDTKEKVHFRLSKGVHQKRSRDPDGYSRHSRGEISQLACQCGACSKAARMANVRRLYESQ
ncbi:uncharacterized protein LOC116024068 [Ipomoea triloba]|uniref:uncharacterized protein LOC116024068 n=1 Tax=Ipomoea triloba TaxID=35885 RepID=UPI00125E20C7|nr:uncharacterized protein LOC116024068 [Ipomoea triloba]